MTGSVESWHHDKTYTEPVLRYWKLLYRKWSNFKQEFTSTFR